MIMVAGHLQIKKNRYYMVLNLKDKWGGRKTKWIPTGIAVGGKRNLKAAEDMLLETRYNYKEAEDSEKTVVSSQIVPQMLFSDYMEKWLGFIKNSVEENTYAGYELTVKNRISPYFKKIGVTLAELTSLAIEGFYEYCFNTLKVKGVTIQHYHGLMHKALKYAVRHNLIAANPMDRVERPKAQKFVGSFYSVAELEALFEAAKGDPLEFPILMAAFYGLRRSEIVGLKWKSVDFENNIITINHTVLQAKCDGELKLLYKDRTKNMSSCRSMPLVPQYRELLLKLKEQQKQNRKLCGNSYIDSDYICVNPMGGLYTPNYITQHFSLLLKKHNLRHIRFHDLRHTCASLLLKNGISMREIQEWLGHSNFTTTAGTYAHLETSAKDASAARMAEVIRIDPNLSI
jgi:site-specific recombinase xerD